MAILEIKDLSFKYNNSENHALDSVSIEVEEGDFVLLCGESGSGKSTLLRLIKTVLAPQGEKKGEIFFDGIQIDELGEKASATQIGFVMQSPDAQTVSDTVYYELAFGLENIGEENSLMRRRVAETCEAFGLSDLFSKKVSELSGGQKQILNLAAVMAMNPRVLLLDEPTSRLDPIAEREFLSMLKRINEEFGVTVIISEHRLDGVLNFADKTAILEKGKLIFFDAPEKITHKLQNTHKMYLSLPVCVRLFSALESGKDTPLCDRDGRKYIRENYENEVKGIPQSEPQRENKAIIEIKDAFFKYEKDGRDILSAFTFDIYENEILCILGGNGAGKSTLLKVICGIKKFYRGKMQISKNKEKASANKIALLPQNPQSIFTEDTVREELESISKIVGHENSAEKIKEVSSEFEISHLLSSHPYDISGGEAQRVAIAKILLTDPDIILLDEPTKGMDAYCKNILADMIKRERARNKTIVIITHDVEFAAENADRCALLFDGKIISAENTRDFFSRNIYYTTAASRMTRAYYDSIVTLSQAIEICKKNKKK